MILPSPTHSNKQFNVEELGLSWDTIENRQAFLFPRELTHSPSQHDTHNTTWGEGEFNVGLVMISILAS